MTSTHLIRANRLADFSLQRVAYWLRWISLGCLILALGACQLAEMAKFAFANANASHQWVGKAQSTTVRFEMVDDHIVLPVRVNGSEPLSFVLDSGAGASVIFESHHTQVLPLEFSGELPVSGVGTGPAPTAQIIKDTELKVGDLSLQGLSLVYLKLSEVTLFENLDEVYFDGVIGAPFFERFVTEIDYDRQTIRFSEPDSEFSDSVRQDSGWDSLPLEIEFGVPYLTTTVSTTSEQPISVKLLVDTGYRGPISLTTDTPRQIELPPEYYSVVSQGLSGDVESRVSTARSFRLGRYELNDFATSYSISGGESENDSDGIIGNEVLNHFNLMFDYPNNRLYFKPNQRFGQPIRADRSGLLIRAHRLGAVVKSIASDSAAADSELKLGDVITSIDGQSVTRNNLTSLKRLLASDRRSVSVCWKSEDQQSCDELRLTSRIRQPHAAH